LIFLPVIRGSMFCRKVYTLYVNMCSVGETQDGNVNGVLFSRLASI